MAFYGDLFRPSGRSLAVGDPLYTAEDVEPGFEQELLHAWWLAASQTDPQVVAPDERTLARTPRSVQVALRALSYSSFFADVALRAMVFDLKQVRRYLTDPQLRQQTRQRVKAQIEADTKVLVAHSLGSVVAYETLCAYPDSSVRALVTLGSPLGTRNLVFNRLEPSPRAGLGAWPGAVRRWTNVADVGDVVALVKDLKPLFGSGVAGFEVNNGAHAHDCVSYLTAEQTGRAIAESCVE